MVNQSSLLLWGLSSPKPGEPSFANLKVIPDGAASAKTVSDLGECERRQRCQGPGVDRIDIWVGGCGWGSEMES